MVFCQHCNNQSYLIIKGNLALCVFHLTEYIERLFNDL